MPPRLGHENHLVMFRRHLGLAKNTSFFQHQHGCKCPMVSFKTLVLLLQTRLCNISDFGPSSP